MSDQEKCPDCAVLEENLAKTTALLVKARQEHTGPEQESDIALVQKARKERDEARAQRDEARQERDILQRGLDKMARNFGVQPGKGRFVLMAHPGIGSHHVVAKMEVDVPEVPASVLEKTLGAVMTTIATAYEQAIRLYIAEDREKRAESSPQEAPANG